MSDKYYISQISVLLIIIFHYNKHTSDFVIVEWKSLSANPVWRCRIRVVIRVVGDMSQLIVKYRLSSTR